jgi:predicted deacetylase
MPLPIKKLMSDYTGMLIRLDDIAENMNWALMDRCEKLFDKYDIKPLVGVVPNNKDKDLLLYEKSDKFWEKVRSWQNKGWEISMHGFSHVYDSQTNKKDYFNYGGKSEFFGHNLNEQKSIIDYGLKKFKEEKIKIRSFFAPNHTYDLNTFQALKDSGIKNIIDGYGLIPYTKNGLNFIPQLFYKEIMLPFGIQSTQIHLNYWDEKDYLIFENFVVKNSKKIITFDQAIDKIQNNFLSKVINFLIKIILKFLRYFRKG